MSFLTNIVADLFQQTTGVKSRRLLRRIGTKRLVLAAGALAAGAYAADRASKTQGGGSGVSPSQMRGGSASPSAPAAQTAVPPPPPPAGTIPPPPPPSPAGKDSIEQVPEEAAEEATEAALEALPLEVSFAAVRAMVSAALADGRLEEAERRAIHGHLADSDLSAEQRRQIEADFDAPAGAADIASLVDDPHAGVVVFELATAVTGADGEVSAAEQAFLAKLRAALP